MKTSRGLAALALLVSAGALSAQDNKPAAGDPTVELPKFVVTDNRELPQPESWKYATIAGFEILTNASDKATQRLVKDFEEFRQALSYVWPVPQRLTQSASLIISGKGNKFDIFMPKGAGVEVATASRFLKGATHSAIVIDLQSTTLNVLNVDGIDDAATGTDSGLVAVEHDKQLYREFIRYLLSKNEPRMPAWFEEGLSQIIMRMQIHDRRTIEFAKLEDPNTISASAAMVQQVNQALAAAGEEGGDVGALPGAPAEDRDFNSALRRRALVPLDKFFAVKHNSSEATNVLGNNVWAKQAYAFVHMCLYGENGKFQKPFMAFLQRVNKEPVTEAMFQECFKMSYKQMLMQIRTYCDFTVYESKGIKAVKGGPDLIVPPPKLELREATQAEIGRIKGEALLLAGHKDAAKKELIAAYMRGERDPNLLASLGLFEKANGENERARKFLEEAFKGQTKRADAGLELARMRYAEALAKPGAGEQMFSAAQVKAITAPLLVARQQPPPNVAVYDLMADAWARSAEKPTKDEAKAVIEGAVLFPTRLKLVYQSAFFARDINDLKSAHALADHGIRYAPDAAVKKRFEDLKANLPPAPVEAAAPTPETKAGEAKAPAKK